MKQKKKNTKLTTPHFKPIDEVLEWGLCGVGYALLSFGRIGLIDFGRSNNELTHLRLSSISGLQFFCCRYQHGLERENAVYSFKNMLSTPKRASF